MCKQICDEGDFVVPANYNYSGQTVISGTAQAIEKAVLILKDKGAKKVIKLKTSGPFHTIKLKQAKEAYEQELKNVTFNMQILQNPNAVKVIKNINGEFYTPQDDIKKILANHIISPVRFDKTIKLMDEQNVTQYVEIGPGKALTGFVKKENSEHKTYHISDIQTLEEYLKEEE